MRVFIAIELPESARERLARVQERLRGTKNRIKWVDSSIIHLTLKFLGEIDRKKLEKVIGATEGVARVFTPFEFEIRGAGAFPSLSSPRVIWMGVGEGRQILTNLANRIEEELSKQGFGRENKRWMPHLTMGRIRHLEEREKLASLIQEESDTEVGRLKVHSLSILESRLTPKGPLYTPLKHILLDYRR